MAAVLLAVRVLEVQNRKRSCQSYLDSVVSGATTIEQGAESKSRATKIPGSGAAHRPGKQATLASDPVTRLQLGYTLARLCEAAKTSRPRREMWNLFITITRDTRCGPFHGGFLLAHEAVSSSHCVLQQASKDAYPSLASNSL